MNLTLNVTSLVVGSIILFSGIIIMALWPTILLQAIGQELALKPTSKSFLAWKDPDVPMYMNVHFFNWTNHKDLLDDYNRPYKPILQECGPYRFNLKLKRSNITWNENNTVTYKQGMWWIFDEENSNGTLDDIITTLNVVPLSAAFVARDWSYFTKKSMQLAFSSTGQEMHMTGTAGGFLFEGIDNAFLKLGKSLLGKTEEASMYDKFGWFYGRNGSFDFDGVFNVETGNPDISQYGKMRQYNYLSYSPYFTGDCAPVTGSSGMWPPGLGKDSILFYNHDICRPMELDFAEEVDVLGLSAYRFEAMEKLYDNGTIYPKNKCYNVGEGIPSGMMNISTCRMGAPFFLSNPHMYLADSYYRNLVEGMQPNREKHRFYMTVEPNSGAPIDVAVRLQLNVLLRPIDYFRMYENVPKLFMPLMWFEQRTILPEEMIDSMKILQILPMIGNAVGAVLFCVGLIIVSVMSFIYYRRKSKDVNESSSKSKEEVPMMETVKLAPENNS